MNFIEFIGFVVSLLALLILAVKKSLEERRRRANPEEFEMQEQEQAEKLKAFLKSLDMDMEEAHKPQPPSPLPISKPNPIRPKEKIGAFSSRIEKHKLDVNIEKRKLKSAIENHRLTPSTSLNAFSNHQPSESDAYTIKSASSVNRALKTVLSLKSRKEMIILQEIISPPKGFRG